MAPVSWILAIVGGFLAFLLVAGSAAGVFRRIDFYSALGVSPLPLLAMYFSAPGFFQAIREGAPPHDLLTIGGPFLIGCVTLLGTFASFRQQSSGRQHWS